MTPPTFIKESEVLWMNASLIPFWNGSTADLQNRRVLHYGQFSAPVSVLLAVLMSLMVFVTVLGNALVILAFIVDKSLRTQGNFFFLNLAIADFFSWIGFLVFAGGFCIPVYIPYVLTGKWKLGRGLCKLWLVVDYLLCTASVFNIVLISFDRFISVTRADVSDYRSFFSWMGMFRVGSLFDFAPFGTQQFSFFIYRVSYRSQKGVTRGAVLKMASVWLGAFLLYGPAIISWEHIAGKSILPEEECYAEFYFNWYFLMTASTVEFFTPFISVTYFNLSIYINIRKRTLMKNDNPAPGPGEEMVFLGKSKRQQVFFVRPAARKNEGKKARASRFSAAKVSIGDSSVKKLDCHSMDLPPLQLEELPRQPADCCYRSVDQFCGTQCRSDVATSMATRFRLSRDKKVAKSLAVIVCVFGLCWAPYTLMMIIRAVCHGQCVQYYLYEISFWLLWLNSSINPVLYPLCHMSFRKAFMKLLCPRKIKIQPQL